MITLWGFNNTYIVIGTLITLLRILCLCHFGSTSFVLPIRPKYGILNRVIRVVVHGEDIFVRGHPYIAKALVGGRVGMKMAIFVYLAYSTKNMLT